MFNEEYKYMDNNRNKVCVYTICKNEEKNIDKWFTSVKDADLICLVDTGSTDSTVDKIKEYQNMFGSTKVIYMSYIQDEFSFSMARNRCLEMAQNCIINQSRDLYKQPHDYYNWAYVSLDLDEFIEPGGINKIREIWSDDYDVMEMSVECIASDGSIESTSFVHHKVHSKEFYWTRDIHEIITKTGSEKYWRILPSDIGYKHIQDKEKPRNYYEILKNSFKRGDRTSKTLVYLAWEAYEHSDWEEMYRYAKLGLLAVTDNSSDENYMDYQYILCLRRYIALYYIYKNNWDIAYNELLKCIDIFATGKFPRTRVIYREIARVAWEVEKVKSIMYYSQFFDIHCPEEYWVEDFNLYTYKSEAEVYSELSNAYFYCDLGYDWKMQSIFYAETAYSLDPENETIKYNLECLHGYFRQNNTPEV